MRTGTLLLSTIVAAALGLGCKSDPGTSAAPDPAAVKAQQALVARRDALLAQRDKLKGEAERVQEEITRVAATGGDTTDLAKKKAELDSQIQAQDQSLDSASTELSAITTKLDAAGGVAAREARVAEREKTIADRERGIAERERQLSMRDAESAKRWAEGCVASATPVTTTIIQQAAPPKSGGTYTRKEVDALYGRAKAQMAKKGLVASDLGPQASLDGEITKALGESDWTRGYILATQLAQTIDAIQINRPFIKAKYDRLAARVRGAKVDEATQGKLETGMKNVMQKYGDGDFAAANRLINALSGELR